MEYAIFEVHSGSKLSRVMGEVGPVGFVVGDGGVEFVAGSAANQRKASLLSCWQMNVPLAVVLKDPRSELKH